MKRWHNLCYLRNARKGPGECGMAPSLTRTDRGEMTPMSTPCPLEGLEATNPMEVMEISLLLPSWQVEALESAARNQGLTTGQMMRRLLGEYFTRSDSHPDPDRGKGQPLSASWTGLVRS